MLWPDHLPVLCVCIQPFAFLGPLSDGNYKWRCNSVLRLMSLNPVAVGKSRSHCGLTRQFGKETCAVLLRRLDLAKDCVPIKEWSPTAWICILAYMEHLYINKDVCSVPADLWNIQLLLVLEGDVPWAALELLHAALQGICISAVLFNTNWSVLKHECKLLWKNTYFFSAGTSFKLQ